MMFRLTILMLLAVNVAYADDLKLVSAARKEVGVTKQYDPNCNKLDYPNGDVALSKGVCTDVVIRALRISLQLELQKLAASQDSEKYQAGDIVTVMLPGNLPHIMVVSDKKELLTNTPLVIQNIGCGAREETSLFLYPISGHYRLPVSNTTI